MRALHSLPLIGFLLPVAAAVACYGPTEVVVSVSTDLACSDRIRTAIYKGRRGELEPIARAETTTCNLPEGGTDADIGSLVFVPSGGPEVRLGLRLERAERHRSSRGAG